MATSELMLCMELRIDTLCECGRKRERERRDSQCRMEISKSVRLLAYNQIVESRVHPHTGKAANKRRPYARHHRQSIQNIRLSLHLFSYSHSRTVQLRLVLLHTDNNTQVFFSFLFLFFFFLLSFRFFLSFSRAPHVHVVCLSMHVWRAWPYITLQLAPTSPAPRKCFRLLIPVVFFSFSFSFSLLLFPSLCIYIIIQRGRKSIPDVVREPPRESIDTERSSTHATFLPPSALTQHDSADLDLISTLKINKIPSTFRRSSRRLLTRSVRLQAYACHQGI